MRCTYCGAGTHTRALCPHTYGGSAARANLRCSYCGGRDHDVEACKKTYSGSAARAWYPDRVADHFVRDIVLVIAALMLAACARHDTAPQAVAAVGQGINAAALAVVDALPLPVPTPPAPAPACIPDEAINLIIAFEIGSPALYTARYQRPVWPGAASGATVGIGYDLGHRAARAIGADWAQHPQHPRLQTASGITGPPARAVVTQLADIAIGYPMAFDVFATRSLAEYCNSARRAFVPLHFDAAPPPVQGALVSVVYHRGASMTGNARTEMRAIRDDCLPRNDAACVAAQIRSMKRINRGTPIEAGISRRREAEATLAEAG